MKRNKREDRVLQAIRELSANRDWCTAQEVADHLDMDRANTSKTLNALERLGQLRKLPGRPVRFCLPEKAFLASQPLPPEPFDHMIGYDGSLTGQVKQAKAAVLYPPRGLNTILTGPTGTGKTTFAREMYEYARHMKIIQKDAAFVVLNCAEYVKNPQLLMSQLFGHRKGTFTGADSDKVGLVEKADGGILLLDEIHCLPAEGQEMLFTLIDSGSYRRLGETERTRTADVLLIGATTEDIRASLLKTFLRRIPVVITLPSLAERPLFERLEFIDVFFRTEQENVNVPVVVSREVIGHLIEYDCPGNVGQLKADIQLLCAGAFWQYRNLGRQAIELELEDLPPELRHPTPRGKDRQSAVSVFLEQLPEFLVWGEMPSEWAGRPESYGTLDEATNYLRRKSWQDVTKAPADLTREVRRYMDRAERASALPGGRAPELPESAATVLSFAEYQLKRKLSRRAAMGLALYLQERCQLPNGMEHLSARQLEELSERHEREYDLALLLQRSLEEGLHLRLKNYDVALLTLFLCVDNDVLHPKVGVMVLAHGESTAHSMATAANEILHCDHCRGLDIPVSLDIKDILTSLGGVVDQVDQGMGVLFLVDMASLEKDILPLMEEKGVRAQVICFTSTPVVVEAVRLANSGLSLEEVAEKLRRLIRDMLQDSAPEQSSRLPLLLIHAPAGQQEGKSIAEMLSAILGPRARGSVDVRYLSGSPLPPEELKRALVAVGPEPPSIPGLPFISVDELVIGNGIRQLESLLGNSMEEEGDAGILAISPSVLTHVLKEVLTFLDADKVRPLIINGLICCQTYWEQQAVPRDSITELDMRYVIHAACMLERLLKQDFLPYNDVELAKSSRQELFQTAKRSVAEMEEFFHLTVPDTELAYLSEILGSPQTGA